MRKFSSLFILVSLLGATQSLALSPEEIFKKSEKGVVTVIADDEGLGSGFMIDSQFFVTNSHVILVRDPALLFNTSYLVKVGGKKINADLMAYDVGYDLALLRLHQKVEHSLPLGRKLSQMNVGEGVFAVGAPFGLEKTFTKGIVSAKRPDKGKGSASYVQVDVPLNPGNSGGPLLDSRAQVVGVNTMTIRPDWGSGIGFAIANDTLQSFLNDISSYKKGGVSVAFTCTNGCNNLRLIAKKIRKSEEAEEERGLTITHQFFSTNLFFDKLNGVSLQPGHYDLYVIDSESKKMVAFKNQNIRSNTRLNVAHLSETLDSKKEFLLETETREDAKARGSESSQEHSDRGEWKPKEKIPAKIKAYENSFHLALGTLLDSQTLSSSNQKYTATFAIRYFRNAVMNQLALGVDAFYAMELNNSSTSSASTPTLFGGAVSGRYYFSAENSGLFPLARIGYASGTGRASTVIANVGLGFNVKLGDGNLDLPFEIEGGTLFQFTMAIGFNF